MATQQLRKLFHRITLSQPAIALYDRIWPARTLGQRGERAAERHLLRLGMIIVARSYTNNFGEIDLVAVDRDTIVFVEVKTRSSNAAGEGFEAVDDIKQNKIAKTAMSFMKQHRLTNSPLRFDVVSIHWPDEQSVPEVQHFQSAFETPGEYQIY